MDAHEPLYSDDDGDLAQMIWPHLVDAAMASRQLTHRELRALSEDAANRPDRVDYALWMVRMHCLRPNLPPLDLIASELPPMEDPPATLPKVFAHEWKKIELSPAWQFVSALDRLNDN